MPDEGSLTLAPRRDSQLPGLVLALVLGAAFAYASLGSSLPFRVENPAARISSAFVAAALLAVAAFFAWRMRYPGRWSTVIDGDGVHSGPRGKTIRWDEVAHVGVYRDGGGIRLAEHPSSGGRGVAIDVANSDRDEAEILAAIERFSRAAGCELELPLPRGRSSS